MTTVVADLAGQQLLTDIASVCGALLAIGAVVAAASRLRPVRWLWRNLVADPVGEWFDHRVAEAVAPIREQFTNNGGSTARDAIDRIEGRIEDLARAVGPILVDFRRSHPEARPDLDDDGGQT